MSNEKLEDIVAEMRKDMPRVVDTKVILRNYADRIEAAVKREAADSELLNPINFYQINSSKVRKALETITHHFCTNCPNDGPDGCELPEEVLRFELLCPKLKQARAALSAPARNCDVFTSESEMKAAFTDYYNELWCLKGTSSEIDYCDLKHNIDGILHDYIEWLLSEAKGNN